MLKKILLTFLTYLLFLNQISYGVTETPDKARSMVKGINYIKYENTPDNAFVDKIHTLKSPFLSDLEKSLYALRYLKTAKLLRARKALLELLADRDETLNRDNPIQVKKIYPENKQINLLLEQLKEFKTKSKNNKFDKKTFIKNRSNSLNVLVRVSALLNLIDAKIKYLTTTLYKEHHITLGKKRIEKDFGIDKMIAILLGQKSYILTKYPILLTKIDNQEFYLHIYNDLLEGQFFPLPIINHAAEGNDFTKRVIYNSVKSKKDSRPLKFKFDEKLSNKISNKWKKFSIKKMSSTITDYFTKALITSLEANTIALNKINSELLIKNSKDIFNIIAADEESWSELPSSFPFINKEIFINGKKQFIKGQKGNLEKSKEKSKLLNNLGLSTIGIAALIGIAGVGAIPVLLVSSIGASFFIYNDYKDYTQSKEYLFTAKHLYFAGSKSFDESSVNDFIELNDKHYRSLIFSSMLGAVSFARPFTYGINTLAQKSAKGLEKVSIYTANGLEKRVRLSRIKFQKLKNNFNKLFSQFSILNNPTTKQLKNKKDILKNIEKVRNNQASQYLIKTGRSLKESLKNSSIYQKFLSDPLLMNTLGRELAVELTAIILGEYLIRGDKFWSEFHFVLMNTLLGVGLIGLIVVKGMKQRELMWDAWNEKKYPLFIKRWLLQAKDLAIPSMGIAMTGNLSIEMFLHFNQSNQNSSDSLTLKERIERTLFMSLFMASFIGFASAPRSELVYRKANRIIDNGILKGLRKGEFSKEKWIGETLKIPLSFSNNLIGVTAVTILARETGLQQNKKSMPKSSVEYLHYENNTENYRYLFELPNGL